ncbi:MAG TPA: hypothetical protein VID50_00075 [Candidatus Eisenbacteria bacterium]
MPGRIPSRARSSVARGHPGSTPGERGKGEEESIHFPSVEHDDLFDALETMVEASMGGGQPLFALYDLDPPEPDEPQPVRVGEPTVEEAVTGPLRP